jgi:DNA repair exonuclease SbcCD ATPase subunit
MGMQQIGVMAGVALGAVVLFYLAWRLARWRRRRMARKAAATARALADRPAPGGVVGSPAEALSGTVPPSPVAPAAAPGAGPDPVAQRLERRMEELEAIQADLAERLAELGGEGGADRLQAMAGSLLKLVKDKDATLQTALAGLDGLRARLATLEAIGDMAEARNLFEGMKARLDALEAVQARAAEGEGPFAEITRQLTQLHGQKDAAVETVFTRLAPLEAKLGAIEGRIAGLDAEGLLERFGERLETVRAGLEARIDARDVDAGPVAEIAERLARLHGQKDATVEAMLARLAPLEAKLAEVEGRLGGLDPRAALERFTERLDAARAALEAEIAAVRTVAAGAADGARGRDEAGFAAMAEQLAGLYAQKDAAMETVLGRLAPLETKLAGLEARIAGLDPAAALARFGERLEAVQGRLAPLEAAAEAAGAEPGPDPVAEIAAAFARLQEHKDAAVETVLGRLAPLDIQLAALEARLAAQDPAAALTRIDERLGALGARVAGLEAAAAAERPAAEGFAAAVERMDALQAEREAVVAAMSARLAPLEAVTARLAPLEARLADIESTAADGAAARASIAPITAEIAGLRAALDARETAAREATREAVDALAARIETRLQGEAAARAAALAEARSAIGADLRTEIRADLRGDEDRLAAFAERLAALHEGREAATEAVFARLAGLEESLGAMGARIGGLDPAAALAGLAARLEEMRGRVTAVEAAAKAPLAEIAEAFAALQAGKDAAVETVLARLVPLEAKLGAVEARLGGLAPQDALARFAERLEAVRGRVEELEAGDTPLAEITAQLAKLHEQKDAGVETVFARLAPLEAKLGAVEAQLGGLAPQDALARFGERLEALQARMVAFEEGEGATIGDLAAQLAALGARKDAAVETVFARLAPLEAQLGALETRLGEADPAAALAPLAERLAAAEAAQAGLEGRLGALESPEARPADPLEPLRAEVFAEIAGLREARDAALDAVAERLAGLERELGALETRSLSEAEARAEAQAIAAQMVAARTVAEETRLFADRLTLLEASLPRLTLAQSLMMQALERQAAPWPAEVGAGLAAGVAGPVPATAPVQTPKPATDDARGPILDQPPPAAASVSVSAAVPAPVTTGPAETAEIWRSNPRVVSLQRSGG